jgi:hypothetical protein
MKCPRCQHKKRAPAKFCGECATPLKAASPGGPSAPSYADVTSALSAAQAQVTEALEQQTATSEILRVMSSSPGDIQPVFDAIAANAARLCDAVNGLVIRFDGQLLHLAAHHNVDPERLAAVRQAYPRSPSRGALSGRAILRLRGPSWAPRHASASSAALIWANAVVHLRRPERLEGATPASDETACWAGEQDFRSAPR